LYINKTGKIFNPAKPANSLIGKALIRKGLHACHCKSYTLHMCRKARNRVIAYDQAKHRLYQNQAGLHDHFIQKTILIL